MAQALQVLPKVPSPVEAQGALAERTPCDYLRLQPFPKIDPLADADFASRSDQDFPALPVQLLSQQHFHAPGQEGARGGVAWTNPLGADSGPASEQARPDHPGVVQNQQIAWPQQFGQFGEGAVEELSRVPLQHQHARSPALARRLLGNQFRRQGVVKV